MFAPQVRARGGVLPADDRGEGPVHREADQPAPRGRTRRQD